MYTNTVHAQSNTGHVCHNHTSRSAQFSLAPRFDLANTGEPCASHDTSACYKCWCQRLQYRAARRYPASNGTTPRWPQRERGEAGVETGWERVSTLARISAHIGSEVSRASHQARGGALQLSICCCWPACLASGLAALAVEAHNELTPVQFRVVERLDSLGRCLDVVKRDDRKACWPRLALLLVQSCLDICGARGG